MSARTPTRLRHEKETKQPHRKLPPSQASVNTGFRHQTTRLPLGAIVLMATLAAANPVVRFRRRSGIVPNSAPMYRHPANGEFHYEMAARARGRMAPQFADRATEQSSGGLFIAPDPGTANYSRNSCDARVTAVLASFPYYAVDVECDQPLPGQTGAEKTAATTE